MCKECRTPDVVSYVGNSKVLTASICACDNCFFVLFSETGPRCEKCGCLMPTQLTTDAPSSWEPKPLWLIKGRPIRIDRVMHTPEPTEEIGEEIDQ